MNYILIDLKSDETWPDYYAFVSRDQVWDWISNRGLLETVRALNGNAISVTLSVDRPIVFRHYDDILTDLDCQETGLGFYICGKQAVPRLPDETAENRPYAYIDASVIHVEHTPGNFVLIDPGSISFECLLATEESRLYSSSIMIDALIRYLGPPP